MITPLDLVDKYLKRSVIKEKVAGISVHDLHDIAPCDIENDFKLEDAYTIEGINEMNELYFESIVKDCLYWYALDALLAHIDVKNRERERLDQRILDNVRNILGQKHEITKIMKRYEKDDIGI